MLYIFTDSRNPQLYKLSLDKTTGESVIGSPVITTIPLTCDFVFDTESRINVNGIEAREEEYDDDESTTATTTLFIVNSATGKVYNVDSNTGCATEVSLDGDGMVLLSNNILYVVENRKDQNCKNST